MSSAARDTVDPKLLIVLDAVLEERSVKRAAARLGLTPSAVSHALSRVRDAVGDPLVVRTPAGLSLTVRAERLAPRLRAALAALRVALEDEPPFDPLTAERKFTISSADLATFVLLAPLERHTSTAAPGLRIVVRPPRDNLFEQLAAGTVDLAFGVFNEAPAGFRYQALLREEFVCLVRAGHPAVRPAFTLERYLALKHIVIAPQGGHGSMVDGHLARMGHGPREIALVVPHFLVAPFIVAETDLALTLPARVAHRYSELLPLQLLAPPIELDGFILAQIWHERAHHDPSHAWLRQAVSEIARAQAPPKLRGRAARG